MANQGAYKPYDPNPSFWDFIGDQPTAPNVKHQPFVDPVPTPGVPSPQGPNEKDFAKNQDAESRFWDLIKDPQQQTHGIRGPERGLAAEVGSYVNAFRPTWENTQSGGGLFGSIHVPGPRDSFRLLTDNGKVNGAYIDPEAYSGWQRPWVDTSNVEWLPRDLHRVMKVSTS